MRAIVVGGTDTEVGKTVICAAVAAAARARGARVAVVKPWQTGVQPGEPGDLAAVRELSGVDDIHEFSSFSEPLAPATAARRAGRRPIAIGDAARRIEALADRDVVIVEGAGWVLVRLDADGGTLIDLAARLVAPILLVVRAGLGTLNHTALTCQALAARGVRCVGVVIGSWPAQPDLAARCNCEDLPRYAGVPLLGALREGAGRLDRGAFLEAVETDLPRITARLFEDRVRA
jgi:dethiobiotin synthase